MCYCHSVGHTACHSFAVSDTLSFWVLLCGQHADYLLCFVYPLSCGSLFHMQSMSQWGCCSTFTCLGWEHSLWDAWTDERSGLSVMTSAFQISRRLHVMTQSQQTEDSRSEKVNESCSWRALEVIVTIFYLEPLGTHQTSAITGYWRMTDCWSGEK